MQLKENAFSIPTAQADVRDPFEEQEHVMGLLECAGEMCGICHLEALAGSAVSN